MTREIAASDPLVSQLDPQRSYGDLSFDEVVAGVQSGRFTIAPGTRLPVLKDAATGRMIKGSGQVSQQGVSIQQAAIREFRELAADDMHEAYGLLLAGMRSGDPRFSKLYWENFLGKMGESKGGDAMATAFTALIEALQKPEVRTIEIIEQ